MNPAELQQRVQDAKDRVSAATLANLKAEAGYDTAIEHFNEISSRLKSEFGVENLDQAKVLLAKLQEEVHANLEEVEKALENLE